MAHAVADLLALLDHLGIERTALLGYSMGGRVALHFALAAPERLSALVLESASPGIADPQERAARVASDDAAGGRDRARRHRGLRRPLAGAAAVRLAARARRPTSSSAQRTQRLANSPLGLANTLRGMGAGAQDYLLPRLHAHRASPTLLLAGALDTALRRPGADAWPREIAGSEHRRSSPAPATPPTSSSRTPSPCLVARLPRPPSCPEHRKAR